MQDSEEHVQERGVVQWFDPARGYGFVRRATGGKGIFLHISQVADANTLGVLDRGVEVEFEVAEQSRGPAAVNVTLAVPAPTLTRSGIPRI